MNVKLLAASGECELRRTRTWQRCCAKMVDATWSKGFPVSDKLVSMNRAYTLGPMPFRCRACAQYQSVVCEILTMLVLAVLLW